MQKKLEEMTLNELWQLFPIFLVEPKEEWAQWYEEEKDTILSLVPHKNIVRISHIGSTAISGIWAKNIIDILLEVPEQVDLEYVKNLLLQNGWRCMNQSSKRITLNKGYTQAGFADKVFHLHLRIAGDHDELYFRDYLNENKEIAQEYQKLKLSLWKKFEHDRDAYTDAKTDFIKNYTQIAKVKYGEKYSYEK